ncbi:hypothetical protein JL722_2994 [Aureococcus anophagefferens]|nr:hypothetical protein JL722_2994 [Aureococcus anophagefferens]
MEVYLTRRDGTVATHGVDLTNATGVDALVADFEERYLAEEPRLAAELLGDADLLLRLRVGPVDGRRDAPAARGSVGPFADGCVPFLTAFAENPGERTGAYRPLFSPHAQCAFPRQLFFHYNAGDTFWFEKDAGPWNMCNSVSWWLARFLGDWARHGGPPGLVLDVGANVGQEAVLAASFGHSVVAYEPFPDTLATAAFNAAANCVTGVTLRPFATSDGASARCGGRGPPLDGLAAGDGVFRDRVVASQRVLAGDASDGVCLNVTTLDAERAPVDRSRARRRVASAEARVDGRQRVEPVAGGVERGLDLGPAVVLRRARRSTRRRREALRKGDAKLEPALAARAASLRRVWKREPKGHELFKIFDRNGKGFELAELHRMIRRDLRLKPADMSDDEIAKLVKTLDVDGTGCIDVAALGEYADGKARAWATERMQQTRQASSSGRLTTS